MAVILIVGVKMTFAQGFGHCPFGNYPFGHCVKQPEPSRGGGGSGTSLPPPLLFIDGLFIDEEPEIITPYYDVIVKLPKNIYKDGEIINAEIIIINKGDTPDNDAILTYYLIVNNKTILGGREIFEEIPIGKSVFKRSTSLPKNIAGKGIFVADYSTITQPTIRAYSGFFIASGINYKLILAVFSVLLVGYLFLATPLRVIILKKRKIRK